MQELTLNVPLTHYQAEAQAQYDDVCLAMVREFLQNSTDAGSKVVSFELDEDKVTCSDTGTGLNLEQFQARMLTLGASHKEAGAAGGFGAAKKLLLFAHDKWEVVGQGFICSGRFHQNIYAESGGRAKGLKVTSQSLLIDADKITDAVHSLAGKSRVPSTIKVNGGVVKQGRALRASQKAADFSFGKLYCHRGKPAPNESTGYMIIRTNGIYTAQQWVGGQWVWYLEITKGESKNVLSENRQMLRGQYLNLIHPYINAANSLGKVKEIKKFICDIFGTDFSTLQDEHPEVGKLDVNTHGAPLVPPQADAAKMSAHVKSYTDESEQGAPVTSGPATQVSETAAGVATIEQGRQEQQDAETWAREAKAMGGYKPAPPKHTGDVQKVDPANSWRKPYGIMANGSTPKVFTPEGLIKPKQAQALEVASSVLNLVADALEIARPIPCLLYSDDAQGCHVGKDGKHAVGLDVALVMEGSPFEVLSVVLHEYAHYREKSHDSWFLREKERLEAQLGERAMPILEAIIKAQAQKRKAKGYWL